VTTNPFWYFACSSHRVIVMTKPAEAAKQEAEAMRESDYEAYKASLFRDDWIKVWSRNHGSFEDTSEFLLLH
jgi:hypothetical protein